MGVREILVCERKTEREILFVNGGCFNKHLCSTYCIDANFLNRLFL